MKSGMKKKSELELEIAELREIINTLRESEAKYKSIFEALPVSLQVVDENGIIVEINPFHINCMGKGKTTKSTYLNQNISARPSIVRAGLSEKYRSVLEGATIDEKEVYFPITSGGGDAYSNIRGVPIKRDGEIIGAIYISEDVTQLKKDKEDLIRHRHKLEELVGARTQELRNANVKLQEEIKERKKAEGEKEKIILLLQEALKKVKTLSGFLPICASCKKIRDDKGYWKQIESYIKEHSEAEFSHSLCPDCTRRLYPNLEIPPDDEWPGGRRGR
jgi:PAS domain S-box-containing protein